MSDNNLSYIMPNKEFLPETENRTNLTNYI